MGSVKFSRYVPSWVEQAVPRDGFSYPVEWDLYQVAEESDRRIKAKRIAQSRSLGGICRWGIARLAMCEAFKAQQWDVLGELAVCDKTELLLGMGRVLSPALGGTAAWRASELEQRGLIAKADKLAEELLNIIFDTPDLDISIDDLAAGYPAVSALATASRKLQKRSMESLRKRVAASRKSGSNVLPPPSPNDTASGYVAPRLSEFLFAMRNRIAGKLPKVSVVDHVLSEFSPEEARILAERFGIVRSTGDVSVPTPDIGGHFGKYPARKKALRTAVIHELCGLLCRALPHLRVRHSKAQFIEAACIAWFGDAPAIQDIDTMLRPYRARQKAQAVEVSEWDQADIAEIEGRALSQLRSPSRRSSNHAGKVARK